MGNLWRPFDWQPLHRRMAILLFALWAPACYLANHPARNQPSKDYWKAAAGSLPEPWKTLLIAQDLSVSPARRWYRQ